jgi:hypothetical protein
MACNDQSQIHFEINELGIHAFPLYEEKHATSTNIYMWVEAKACDLSQNSIHRKYCTIIHVTLKVDAFISHVR